MSKFLFSILIMPAKKSKPATTQTTKPAPKDVKSPKQGGAGVKDPCSPKPTKK